MPVGVRRAEHDRRGREQRLGNRRATCPRPAAEEHRDEQRQVAPGCRNQADARPEREAVARLDQEAAREDVVQPAAEQRDEHRDERFSLERLPDRQPEDVERDVAMEERVLVAERHALEEAEPRRASRRTPKTRGSARRAAEPQHRDAREPAAFERDRAAVDAGADDDLRPDERPPREAEIDRETTKNATTNVAANTRSCALMRRRNTPSKPSSRNHSQSV